MNFHRFFANQTWWGKLLGAFLGYLMAGPAGALLGVLIGNFFDRGLSEHFNNPLWHYHAETREQVRLIFFEALFSSMGHVAKADGRVSEQEIAMAKALMLELKLNHKQKKEAEFFFNAGKKDDFNLKPILILLNKLAHSNQNLLRLFINTIYNAAQLDGLSDKKVNIINTILNHTRYAPMNEQSWFNQQSANQQSREQSSRSGTRSPPPHQTLHTLENAYAILLLQPPSNKQEVKRAYRRLISRHHPDKMMAQGASIDKIKQANEKTQIIRKAYEKICASQGW